MRDGGASNKVFAGEIRPDSEVIKVAASIGDEYERDVQRDERGIYLLSHGQQFTLRLSNYTRNRKACMRITGDDDSTVIADDLVIDENSRNEVLKRWLTTDQAFIAYRRDSEEGHMVGADSVSVGGGGLIKIVFTVGCIQQPVYRYANVQTVTTSYRARGGARGVSEGVMGAGQATGQTFREVEFVADSAIPQLEIQLRWAIAGPMAPPDRRVVTAPSLRGS